MHLNHLSQSPRGDFLRYSQAGGTLNDYLLSIVLGIIEGLTEFLPVSSTAHLRIAESLFHINLADGYWKMYTIVIQLGAILCLPIYFRSRIARFLSTFPGGDDGNRTALTHPLGLTTIAFVVTTCYDLLKSHRGKNANPIGVSEIDAHGWIVLAIGFVISFLVAYASVAWFMAWVRKRGFAPFAVYRIVVGALVLAFVARMG